MSSSKKSKSKKARDADVRNEGSDPQWVFEPPGVVLLEELADSGDFDWDNLGHDEDKRELWIIRVPNDVKAKHLKGLEIPIPSSSSQHLGSLDRKNATFDIWSLDQGDTQGEEAAVGGDELRNMSCLLPRKSKKGKLYLAPIPITRHLVLSKKPAEPQTASPSSPLQNPPRHSYPKELLKHRFLPCGALHTTEDSEAEKDAKFEGLPPSKKRKKTALEETGTPKKSKKAKVSKT